MNRTELRALVRAEGPVREEMPPRPQTRADCIHGPRPCPWIGCRYSLYLDVNPETGSIKLNHPGVGPAELVVSCALDVADDGPHTLEQVAGAINVTRERLRQLELQGLAALARFARRMR